MSSNIMMVNGFPNSTIKKDFICDSVDDIEKLPKYGVRGSIENISDLTINNPCAIGSTALICDSGDGSSAVYILTPSNEWKVL